MLLLFALATLQTTQPSPADLHVGEHVLCWGVASVAKQMIDPSAPAAEAARRWGEADRLETTAKGHAELKIRQESLSELAQQLIFEEIEAEISARSSADLTVIYDRCRVIYRQAG